VKIAIVYDAVFPHVKGGAERRYYELAVRLAARGHEVHWYGMRYWEGPRVQTRDGVVYHGVCRALPLYVAGGRRSIVQALVFGLACLRLIRRRYDVIDCCGFPFFSLFSARVATALRGGLLVSTWHEVWGPSYWAGYLGRLGFAGAAVERFAAAVPHSIVAVSSATADRMAGDLGRRGSIAVLPNGVDAELIESAPRPPQSHDIAYAGRLCDFKDVELLIAALPQVLASRPQTTCTIIGDGPHRLVLEEFAASTGVAAAIRFAGFVEDQQEFYGLVNASRVLALPSRREGFGIIVLEANAGGVPVIVADHPDNFARELVSGENGEVVAPVADAMAVALLRVLREAPGSREAACRDAARGHHWDSIAIRYEKLLEEARTKALV
jgi:glycosyltransferase involved in cell wall biosynthesis